MTLSSDIALIAKNPKGDHAIAKNMNRYEQSKYMEINSSEMLF